MVVYTSPFEKGYKLMNEGLACECTETAGTQKDEGKQGKEKVECVNRDE